MRWRVPTFRQACGTPARIDTARREPDLFLMRHHCIFEQIGIACPAPTRTLRFFSSSRSFSFSPSRHALGLSRRSTTGATTGIDLTVNPATIEPDGGNPGPYLRATADAAVPTWFVPLDTRRSLFPWQLRHAQSRDASGRHRHLQRSRGPRSRCHP